MLSVIIYSEMVICIGNECMHMNHVYSEEWMFQWNAAAGHLNDRCYLGNNNTSDESVHQTIFMLLRHKHNTHSTNSLLLSL